VTDRPTFGVRRVLTPLLISVKSTAPVANAPAQSGARTHRTPKLDSVRWLAYESQTNMDVTSIYFLIFGALTIIGGVIGYVKAGSLPSIIAGAITGVLLLAAGWILPTNRTTGLIIGLIVSVLLAAQFVPKFIRTKTPMPAGLMSILSIVGIVVTIVAWLKK